jgi:hypothetical protein
MRQPVASSSQEATDVDGTVASGSDAGRYLFRADDRYRGGLVGRALGPEADTADIQSLADHILRKESRLTSRFTSFTTEVKIARKFTQAPDNRFIRKAELAALKALEAQGVIRMWDADQVYEVVANGPKKMAKRAADVRAAMKRNHEVLIEGQIPAGALESVNE